MSSLASAPSVRPHVVVIGGGAAGHLAAITCARQANLAVSVTLLEASPAVLSKVRASGGGRCNVTSALPADNLSAFAANYPRGTRLLPTVLAAFGPRSTCAFFEAEGVALKVEKEKIFPQSDDSSTIVNALSTAARHAQVRVRTRARVVALRVVAIDSSRFSIALANGEQLLAEYVVVATGSARAPWRWATELGHRVIPGVPSLFSFGMHDARLTGLAGVSAADVIIRLAVDGRTRRRVPGLSQRGPLLITHWGLSGPAVLALSAFAARELHTREYSCDAIVDWLPDISEDDTRDILLTARRAQSPRRVLTASPVTSLSRRLWAALATPVLRSETLKWGEVSNAMIQALTDVLRRCTFHVERKGEFKDEFVTAGGVALSDVNGKTLESKHAPGLYFAGETLDVDGRTGGFNLEFAWSSGHIVGTAIADQILLGAHSEVSSAP